MNKYQDFYDKYREKLYASVVIKTEQHPIGINTATLRNVENRNYCIIEAILIITK